MQLSPKTRISIGQIVFIWISSVQRFSWWARQLNKTKHYYGTRDKNFKERYNSHTASFKNKAKEKSTELIWELKDNNIEYNLKWRIASKAHPHVCESRKCNLCLTEKLTIIKADHETLLNTRDELVSKCRYMNKFTLRRLKKD